MNRKGQRRGGSRRLDARTTCPVTVWVLFCVLCVGAYAEDVPKIAVVLPLDRGFSGLYNLDFSGAQKDFAAWQKLHPDDPVGPVSEAAGLLFSEFNRLGVLEAQFYENDKAFVDRPKQTADPALQKKFQAAIEQTETLAHAR